MCGIVGYIGNKNTDYQLVNLLKNLEYRGYDSAGIAYQLNNKIKVIKEPGKIANLESKILNEFSTCGIAHTRWATHGKPTKVNAHPHISQDNNWAVVHNGIIENFETLRKEIKTHNINFISETDTETIPHLLQINHSNSQSPIKTLINTCSKLTGSYAIACINKDIKDTLFLAKKKSPLYVTTTSEEVFVASDPICFTGKAKDYFVLNEDEFCEARVNNLVFYDKNNNIISKKPIELGELNTFAGKNNYDHFMLKEIEETPIILKRIVDVYSDNTLFNNIKDVDFNKIVIVGCGTAYHSGLMAAKYIEKFARIECRTYIASEFRYTDPLIDEHTLSIFISQSGETADTLAALELAKSKGSKTIGLTNVTYSSLAKAVDFILPINAGPEIAVASTKAYTAQITIMYMFARFIQNLKQNTYFDFIEEIRSLANNLQLPDTNEIKALSKKLINENQAFFIGRDLDYITCEESSLKLKEITYINSTAYPSGELKHGFLALIDNGTYLFVIATNSQLLDKTLNGAHEAYARGGKIVLATQLDIPKHKTEFVDTLIKLQELPEHLMPIITTIYFQYLSYFTSISKGINPDQPRNLAKSVTVE